jgi:ankyrin repeat protein
MRFSAIFFSAFLCLAAAAGCSSFHDTVKTGSPDDIRRALFEGAKVNKPDGSGNTPLINAVRFNARPADAAAVLLGAGADVKAHGEFDRTALHFAMQIQSISEALGTAKLLLEKGAEVNAAGSGRETPLYSAVCRRESTALAELLLSKGADVSARNVQQNTPLHEAARIRGNEAMIILLLSKGADVNAGDGFTPLHSAAAGGSAGNMQRLLARGADIRKKGAAAESKTALEAAVDANSLECVRVLLEHGADVNSQTYYYFKPFRYRSNTQNSAQKLVHGDAGRIDFERMTPLQRAVTHKNREMVKLILSHKPRLDLDGHFGGYALDFAMDMCAADIAGDIYAAGGRMMYADMYLSDFTEKNDAQMVDLVCAFGANPNARRELYGNMPLHEAALAGSLEAAEVLLKHGADKTIANNAGKRPFELAKDEALKKLLAAE